MQNNHASEIKNRITMTDLCNRYGLAINERGFVCCPLHGEKTPSMKIYPGRRGYCCFGCGESGDVIDFAQKFFNVSFRDAIAKLNNDFGLGLSLDNNTVKSDPDALRRYREEQKRRDAAKKEKEEAERDYWLKFDHWRRLCSIRDKYTPKDKNADLSPLWLNAVHLMPIAEIELDKAEERRMKANNAESCA